MNEEQLKLRILNLRETIIEALDEFEPPPSIVDLCLDWEPNLNVICAILAQGLEEDEVSLSGEEKYE